MFLRIPPDFAGYITERLAAQQHQGDGHGRAILQALENRAAQLGYQQAVLVTGPDQHPAIDLYLSAGYRRTGIERHGELIGVRMLKPIPRGN